MPPAPVDPYLPVAISLIIAVVFSLAFVGMSRYFGPHRPNKTKESVYECGMPSLGPAHQRFSVKFYLVAMLFILFDVEVVFMFPWATSYGSTRPASTSAVLASSIPATGLLLWEAGIFTLVLVIGLVYVLKKGVLDWHKAE